MSRDKSKFTIVLDRTNATTENQDLDFLRAVSNIFQVRFLFLKNNFS